MNTNHSSELMKRYLAIYKKDPTSKVFALLANMYRKEGDLDKALALCKAGLKRNPHYALGHVSLALILLDLNKLELAIEALEKATEYSSENIFAYKLLGQTWLKLKNPEKTLEAYKMVLFLDPKNKKAESIVRKLEPITATQYDKNEFSFKSLKEVAKHFSKNIPEDPNIPTIHPISQISQKEKAQFESRVAIIEALIYRKEFTKAKEFILELKNLYKGQKEWLKQTKSLEKKIPTVKTPHQNLPGDLPITQTLQMETSATYLGQKKGIISVDKNKVDKNKKSSKALKLKIQKLKKLLTRIDNTYLSS